MKKLSLPTLLGMFGGFLVLMLVIALVATRTRHQGPAQPLITKVYPSRQVPSLGQPLRAASPAANDPNTVVPPAGTTAASSMEPESAHPAEECNPKGAATEEKMLAHLAALDHTFEETTSRVAAIEAKLVTLTPVPRATVKARVPSAAELARSQAPHESTLPSASGYKTMAVVGDRAWVRTGDGLEDSATPGDALPVPRVRVVHPETGVIITSSDQRILPQQ